MRDKIIIWTPDPSDDYGAFSDEGQWTTEEEIINETKKEEEEDETQKD